MTEVGFIGDVHGCVDELHEIVAAAAERTSQLVFLGDYVNRGPDSRAVIEYLVDLRTSEPRCIFLAGHHDEAFLDAVVGDGLDRFLRMGGAVTISSYVETPYGDVRAQLRSAMPAEHLDFLVSLPNIVQTSKYIGAHAEEYISREMGDQFKDARFRILGHEPQKGGLPKVSRDVALIDTGCGTSADGRLTCLFWPDLTWIQSGASE